MSTGPASGVRVRGLTKAFGAVRAVRGIDLDVAPGETVALLGPNGAGKSTTLDAILGLTRPDGGTVEVFNRSPGEAVEAGVVAGMLQTGQLIEFLSVRELVTMIASLYPHPLAVDEALELTGCASFATRATRQLSGGQTQRVRMAVALVADPDLLVLDEPTAALDVEGRRDFWTAIRAFAARGKTVLFATHYLEEADAYADRVVLMARGRIVADGSPTEIKAMVGGRSVRLTLANVTEDEVAARSGATRVERHGDTLTVWFSSTAGSDQGLRALLDAYHDARDIEVRGAGLEEAFLGLTGDEGEIDEREPS